MSVSSNLWRVRVPFFGVLIFSLSIYAHGQMPAGFQWVDFKRDGLTVTKIQAALQGENYTAIREIVLADGFALVMVVKRDSDQGTDSGDEWSVFNVSTKRLEAKKLLAGYNFQMADWITFQRTGEKDLGVVYIDCWECEPASVFTAFHYDSGRGWRARWADEKNTAQPGVRFLFTDEGDPYTNEDVDQVFAVIAPHDRVASVGTWYRSRDLSTGKIEEHILRFFVDPSTGKDKSVALSALDARKWKATLCEAADSPRHLSIGQSTSACKQTLNARRRVLKQQ